MRRLRYLGGLLLLSLLMACSSPAPVDLTMAAQSGDILQYQVNEWMSMNAVGEPPPFDPMEGTVAVTIEVVRVDGNQANAVCTVRTPNGNEFPIPVRLNMDTGETAVLANPPGWTPAHLDLLYDRYMLTLGARPGQNQTAVGDRWKGEMRQLLLGTVQTDPVRLPLDLELVGFTDEGGRRLAKVRLWGEEKLDVPLTGKNPGRATGTLSATGTMLIDLETRLVERVETKVTTRLTYSDGSKATEGTYAYEVKRISPRY